MGSKKSSSAADSTSAQHAGEAERATPREPEWHLVIVPDPERRPGMVAAIVLVRWQRLGPVEDDFGSVRRTTLYASSSKYDVMDEFQRLAHRIYMLGEGELVEEEARARLNT
jgi:hypothetical protein